MFEGKVFEGLLQKRILFLGPNSPHSELGEAAFLESLALRDGLHYGSDRLGVGFRSFDFIDQAPDGGLQAMHARLQKVLLSFRPTHVVAYLASHATNPDMHFLQSLPERYRLNTCLWASVHYQPKGAEHLGIFFNYICCPDDESASMFEQSECKERIRRIPWGAVSYPALKRTDEQEFQVTYVGSRSQYVDEYLSALTNAGISTQCFGQGFPNGKIPPHARDGLGASSEISLLLRAYLEPPIENLGREMIENAGRAHFQLVKRFPGIEQYLVERDNEVVTFDSAAELVQKAEFYLNNRSRRQAVIQSAWAKTQLKHSWANRVQELLVLDSQRATKQTSPRVTRTKSSMATPKVTVVIPSYSQAQFLPAAVESVVRQSSSEWECIIVDDGSPDESAQVAERLIQENPGHPIRLIRKSNGGLASARNAGIREATTDLILPLDADDLLETEMIERCLETFQANSYAGFVYPQITLFGEKEGNWPEDPYDLVTMLRSNSVPYCSMFRRDLFRDVGGYNTEMREGFEDWDFWIGAIERGYRGHFLKSPLVRYRVKPESMVSGAERAREKLFSQIVLNHRSLYSNEEIAHAREVLQRIGIKPRTFLRVA